MIGFTVMFIFRRLSSNVWCGRRENRCGSGQTDFVAIRLKLKSNRTQNIFSSSTSSRPMAWQSLGIFGFFFFHFAHLQAKFLDCRS